MVLISISKCKNKDTWTIPHPHSLDLIPLKPKGQYRPKAHLQILDSLAQCLKPKPCDKRVCEVRLYLVYEGPPVGVALQQHTSPQFRVLATHQVPGQALEQGVLIAHL